MTAQRQAALFFLVSAAAIVGLLFLFRDILLPFVVGAVIAYLLDPLARSLERRGARRTVATAFVLGFFTIIFVVAFVLIVPLIVSQLASFLNHLPELLARLQQLFWEHGAPLLSRLGGPDAVEEAKKSAGDFIGKGASWIGTFLASLWAGGAAFINLMSLVIVTPVVAFYMLMDWDHLVAGLDGLVPPRHRPTVHRLAHEIDRAVVGFLRGQALVCALLGAFYAIGLSLAGLSFGALIGLTSGLVSFIPYVGTLGGFVVATGVAVVQFWPDWTMIAVIIAIFVVGQFIEGNILSPRLVGGAIGVHPVWLMFALFAFGSLFGFLGLIVAVPLTGAVGVLARFARERYLESALFGATTDATQGPEADG